MQKPARISIVIPAHNEEKRIGKTLESYSKYFSKKNSDFEILVIINNSKDKTLDVVSKYAEKYPRIRFLNFKQGGKGFAIIEGFKDAIKRDNSLIGFVDADMATTPESYFELVENIGDYDGILASRYVPGAELYPKQTLSRIAASRVFNFLIRSIFFMPYKDTQCGAKLFKREVVKSILPRLGVTQWAFDIDLLYQSYVLEFEIKEIPTKWSDIGGSKIRLIRSSLQMLTSIVRLRLINTRFIRIQKILKPPIGWFWEMLK